MVVEKDSGGAENQGVRKTSSVETSQDDQVLKAWEAVVARLVKLNEEKNLFEVRSSSNPEGWYDVDLIHGKCSCIGFSFRGRCKHLKLAEEFSEREGVSQKVQIEKDGDELPF